MALPHFPLESLIRLLAVGGLSSLSILLSKQPYYGISKKTMMLNVWTLTIPEMSFRTRPGSKQREDESWWSSFMWWACPTYWAGAKNYNPILTMSSFFLAFRLKTCRASNLFLVLDRPFSWRSDREDESSSRSTSSPSDLMPSRFFQRKGTE